MSPLKKNLYHSLGFYNENIYYDYDFKSKVSDVLLDIDAMCVNGVAVNAKCESLDCISGDFLQKKQLVFN